MVDTRRDGSGEMEDRKGNNTRVLLEKQRSREAEKQRSREAEKQRSRVR
jgi:hypothetical protein